MSECLRLYQQWLVLVVCSGAHLVLGPVEALAKGITRE